MKILFFIALLINIVFFLWEFNFGGLYSPQEITGVGSYKTKQILLVRELSSQDEEVSLKSAVNNPVLYEPLVSLALNSAINSKTEEEIEESSQQLIKDGTPSIEEFTDNIISSDEVLENEQIEQNTLQHDTEILVASNQVASVAVSPVLEEKLLTVENKEEVVVNSLLKSDESNLETGDQIDGLPVNPVLEEKTLTVESQKEVIVNSLLNSDDSNLETDGQVDGSPVLEEQALPEESHEEGPVDNLLNNDESNGERAGPVINYCYHVGPFANNAALNVWRKSNKIDTGFVSQFTKENNVVSSYLVYFPAAETYAQSRKNVQLLKQKGITDYWLFRRGELKGAISLGLFVKKSRALSLQEKLVKAGFAVEIKERYKKEQLLFAEISTEDKAFKDIVIISDKQRLSECKDNAEERIDR